PRAPQFVGEAGQVRIGVGLAAAVGDQEQGGRYHPIILWEARFGRDKLVTTCASTPAITPPPSRSKSSSTKAALPPSARRPTRPPTSSPIGSRRPSSTSRSTAATASASTPSP